jgi:hypothetical protein
MSELIVVSAATVLLIDKCIFSIIFIFLLLLKIVGIANLFKRFLFVFEKHSSEK